MMWRLTHFFLQIVITLLSLSVFNFQLSLSGFLLIPLQAAWLKFLIALLAVISSCLLLLFLSYPVHEKVLPHPLLLNSTIVIPIIPIIASMLMMMLMI